MSVQRVEPVENPVLAKAELADVDAGSLEVGDVARQEEVDVVEQVVGGRVELADRDLAELLALDEPSGLTVGDGAGSERLSCEKLLEPAPLTPISRM